MLVCSNVSPGRSTTTPSRPSSCTRSPSAPPSGAAHRLRGAGLGPPRSRVRPRMADRRGGGPPRAGRVPRLLPHPLARRRPGAGSAPSRASGSSSSSSPTPRASGWTCCSGAGTTAASRARAASTSPRSSATCSRPGTGARCPSRSSTTSSGRPTRTARRSMPCARCWRSRAAPARPDGRPARARAALRGYAFVELAVERGRRARGRGPAAGDGVPPRGRAPLQAGRAVAPRRGPHRCSTAASAADRGTPDDRRVVALAVESADPRPLGRRGPSRCWRRLLDPPPRPRRGRPAGDRRPGRHLGVLLPDRAGDAASWLADFTATGSGARGWARLTHIDHVALAHPFDAFDEAALFYRSVLGLEPRDSLELAAPDGLVRSRAVTERRRQRAPRAQRPAARRRPARRRGRAPARRLRLRRRARGRGVDARARRAAAAHPRQLLRRPGGADRPRAGPDRRDAGARRALRPQRGRRAPPLLHGDGRVPPVLRGRRAARRPTTASAPPTHPSAWPPSEDRPPNRTWRGALDELAGAGTRNAATRGGGDRPGAGARHARARAAAQADRPQRDPARRRDRDRRIRPLSVHRLQGRARVPVGRGRRDPHPVLHQHGDRALHARDRGDGGHGVPAAVEALRAADGGLRGDPHDLARAGRRARRPSPRSCSAAATPT